MVLVAYLLKTWVLVYDQTLTRVHSDRRHAWTLEDAVRASPAGWAPGLGACGTSGVGSGWGGRIPCIVLVIRKQLLLSRALPESTTLVVVMDRCLQGPSTACLTLCLVGWGGDSASTRR